MEHYGKFVIVKKAAPYQGGDGYKGIACDVAKIEPGRFYSTIDEAKRDCALLCASNPNGFEVQPWRPAAP